MPIIWMSKLSLVLCRKGWSMHYIAMIDSSWPRGVRENPVTMHWGLKNKDQINDDENIGVSRETSLQQNEKPERNNLSISTMNENNWQWEQEEQQNLFKTQQNLDRKVTVLLQPQNQLHQERLWLKPPKHELQHCQWALHLVWKHYISFVWKRRHFEQWVLG